MKPFIHAKNSVRKYGGEISDYIDIHNFFDISKSSFADMRHRAILHNSLGCFIVERLFGFPQAKMEKYKQKFNWSPEECEAIIELLNDARSNGCTSIINSEGNYVQVRDIAEQHILEDMGKIPSVGDYLENLPMLDWLGGPKRQIKKILFQKEVD